MDNNSIKVVRLGELLVNNGSISQDNLEEALLEQKTSQMRLGEVLIEKGYISELHLAEALSKQLGIPFVSLSKNRPKQEALSMIPENVATRLNVIPLDLPDEKHIVLAMSDPMDSLAIDEIRMLTRLEVIVEVATISDIHRAFSSSYRVQTSMQEAMVDIQQQSSNREQSENVIAYSPTSAQDVSLISTSDAPVVKLVNSIFEQAVREKASDIHIEPSEGVTAVRLRIDGTMFKNFEIPKNLHLPLIARIKILSGMDISEKRRPQDGRILLQVADKRVDSRVSIIPSIFGETAVLRLLDQSNEKVGMDRLGFEPDQIKKLKSAITASNGIFLITGPTGSGKSTTLYSILEIINTPGVNIITLEDPVEYTIPGITQIQINEKIDVTFSNTLRSILRQDPDKLMVGEIRDTETAHLTVRVALTGHLVLSTLHTNDAPTAINRLVDMGVPPFLISSSLRGVLAQRLLRKLCSNCKKEEIISDSVAAEVGIPLGSRIYSPVGCPSCRYTAYSGRTVISELLLIDANLREMINNSASDNEIRDYARKNGMKLLRESALSKVLDGSTSIEEMLSVTMLD